MVLLAIWIFVMLPGAIPPDGIGRGAPGTPAPGVKIERAVVARAVVPSATEGREEDRRVHMYRRAAWSGDEVKPNPIDPFGFWNARPTTLALTAAPH
jgi:hypothetical protein